MNSYHTRPLFEAHNYAHILLHAPFKWGSKPSELGVIRRKVFSHTQSASTGNCSITSWGPGLTYEPVSVPEEDPDASIGGLHAEMLLGLFLLCRDDLCMHAHADLA